MNFKALILFLVLCVSAYASNTISITNVKGQTITGRLVKNTDTKITFIREGKTSTSIIPVEMLSKSTQEKLSKLDNKGYPKEIVTTIEPGKRVVLAIPFIKQNESGLCTAAATLNIIKYYDPSFDLNQEELYKVIAPLGIKGASFNQVWRAAKKLGYPCDPVFINRENKDKIFPLVKSILNDDLPILIGTNKHALLAIGYDDDEIYLWDQGKTKGKKPVDGLPPGTYKLSEREFLAKVQDFTVLRRYDPNKRAFPKID